MNFSAFAFRTPILKKEDSENQVYDGERNEKKHESADAILDSFEQYKAELKNTRLDNAVRRVMEAFEKAKPRMDAEAAKETQQYLDERTWYKDCAQPSEHPCYRRMKRGGRVGLPENFYYPNLLVLQALWPNNRTVGLMAAAFGNYWEDSMMRYGPEYYPELNDKRRELYLFRGEKSDIDVPWGGYDPDFDQEYKPRNKSSVQESSESESGSESEVEDEEEDGNDDGSEDGHEALNDSNRIESDNEENDQEEIELEKNAHKLRAQLQNLEKKKRNVQERKRKNYEEMSQAYEKSSEDNNKKSEEYKRKSEDDKQNAEEYAKKAREHAKKLEQSSNASIDMSASTGQKSLGGRTAKRTRRG
ncbi:hypothetical protein ACHAPJ_008671 [Fusarium lateritium]